MFTRTPHKKNIIQKRHPIAQFLKELYNWISLFICGFCVPLMEMLETRNKLNELPDRKGEVAVITGGAQGFGLEVLKKLLKCGFRVIVGDKDSGENAVQEIKNCGLPFKNVKFLHVDLKSLKSVRSFAAKVLKETDRVDLLFNNAGIMFTPFEETEDGYESQFQVNYLSHFLLIQLLLPTMKKTSMGKDMSCRIVNTASVASFYANFDAQNPGIYEVYARTEAYCNSKLAQVIMTKYLDKKLKTEGSKVRVYSVHPGMVPSKLWDHLFPVVNSVLSSLRRFYRSTEDGANGIIYAALAPELESTGGLYLDNCKSVRPSSEAEDYLIQETLWKKSLEMIQIKK